MFNQIKSIFIYHQTICIVVSILLLIALVALKVFSYIYIKKNPTINVSGPLSDKESKMLAVNSYLSKSIIGLIGGELLMLISYAITTKIAQPLSFSDDTFNRIQHTAILLSAAIFFAIIFLIYAKIIIKASKEFSSASNKAIFKSNKMQRLSLSQRGPFL